MGECMRKSIIIRLCSALLVALLFIIPKAHAAKFEVKIKTILENMGEIIPVNQTNYLMIQSKKNGLYGVYDTDGNKLMKHAMHNAKYIAYGCFEDVKDNNASSKALAVLGAGIVSDYKYDLIKVYNQNWAVGWNLSNATEEAYDYKASNTEFYNIKHCDVFSLAKKPRKVASLSRKQFANAAAHGEYLSIEDREGTVKVYNASFESIDLNVTRVTDGIYGIVDYAVVNRATGEILMDGYSSCREIITKDGLLLQVARTDYSGNQKTGLCNLSGKFIIPLGDLKIKTINGDWIIVTSEDKQGLYSISRKKLVVPCEYDSILTSNQTVDPYVYYGYVCGIKGDTRYYIKIKTGETVSTLQYTSAMRTFGGTVYEIVKRRNFKFIASNGKQWQSKDMKFIASRGDGRLIVMRKKMDGLYGIYNMDGKIVLEFKYKNQPIITDDGKVILNTVKNGYCLIDLSW